MRSIYLVGAPATGKSTTMAALRDELGVVTGQWFKVRPDLKGIMRAEPLHDLVTDEVRGWSLGVNRPGGYAGTDALSMVCQPEAVQWMLEATELPEVLLGEGQRLGIPGFLTALARRSETLVVGHLLAPMEVLDGRCEDRGSTQNVTFRKASASRAANAAKAAEAAGATVVECDTTTLSPQEVAARLARVAGLGA